MPDGNDHTKTFEDDTLGGLTSVGDEEDLEEEDAEEVEQVREDEEEPC